MKKGVLSITFLIATSLGHAANQTLALAEEIQKLKEKANNLEQQLAQMQSVPSSVSTSKAKYNHGAKKNGVSTIKKRPLKKNNIHKNTNRGSYHVSSLQVHNPNYHPESLEFYPTALISDNQVVTYIAGTPVISSPFLGARPAFDGSDYIINISSINRDLRLMNQRRNLYKGYRDIGYPTPDVPIIALSGKIEPIMTMGSNYNQQTSADIDLGANELDIAAILNEYVEAYMGIAYNAAPPATGGRRVDNSAFNLNMGFVNIGNPEKSPWYFTAGQIFIPFGRYSTSMVSPTLPMIISRVKNRPFIFGYKTQYSSGPIVSAYGFRSDTTSSNSGVGGINTAYIFQLADGSGEVGAGLISSMPDATGMQHTGSVPGTTFGGFASLTNGSENIKKIPAVDVHGNVSFDRYSLTAEWVSATSPFRVEDLSYEGRGAQPQALQLEAGVTFRSFDLPSSVAASYQWTNEALSLNLPKQRYSAVYNISIWKDTLESLEFHHDIDYKSYQYANGANSSSFSVNQNTVGTSSTADTVILQLGVFF